MPNIKKMAWEGQASQGDLDGNQCRGKRSRKPSSPHERVEAESDGDGGPAPPSPRHSFLTLCPPGRLAEGLLQ